MLKKLSTDQPRSAKSPLDISTYFTPGTEVTLEGLVSLQDLARWFAIRRLSKNSSTQSGCHASHRRGRGLEFVEARSYYPGDDVRTIDWRVSARTNALHTKVFQEEREQVFFLVCDQSRSLFFGSCYCTKSVRAAELAAVMGWAGVFYRGRIGAFLFNDQGTTYVRPRSGHRPFLSILRALQAMNHDCRHLAAGEKDWCSVLGKLSSVVKPGSHILWIGDFHGFTTAAIPWLYHLKRHSDMTMILVTDGLEHTLPAAGILKITDNDRTLWLDTNNTDVLTKFQQLAQTKITELSYHCQKLRIPLVFAGTDKDPLPVLKQVLHFAR